MRNLIKCLTLTILFSFICEASYGATLYVDKTLNSNCLSGNYSVSNRSCSGTDGNAYKTIQSALDAMSGGDDVYMRGGTYEERSIIVPPDKNGSPNNHSSLKSYPNEWAIIDGQNSTSSSAPIWAAAIGRNNGLSYWEFGHFEIKNGSTSNKSSATGLIYGGDHGYIHHLYIHDNLATTGSNNPCGLKLEKPKNTIVEYCYLYNNGMSSGTNTNAANITEVTDYVEDPKSVKITDAAQKNEYRFNLIESSPIGFKHKNSQWLSLTRDGQTPHTSYKDYGDKLHHNIIKNSYLYPVSVRMDFIQIFNNIIDMTTAKEFSIGGVSADDRHLLYATVYNNTFIKSRPSLYHDGISGGDNSSFTPSISTPAKPYFYFFNNIIESVGAVKDGRNDLNILFTYNDWDVDNNEIDMTTVFIENNLFVPRSTSDLVINVGDDKDDYSTAGYSSAGWATINYAINTTSGLHKSGSFYKTNANFLVDSQYTIANGGIGVNHPYLTGVKLPSYVGATDPKNDSWVNMVLGLSDITNLKFLGPILSTSIINSSASNVIFSAPLPPAPTKLIVVE